MAHGDFSLDTVFPIGFTSESDDALDAASDADQRVGSITEGKKDFPFTMIFIVAGVFIALCSLLNQVDSRS